MTDPKTWLDPAWKEPASLPDWFSISGTTPIFHINNVKRGLHPLGSRLGPAPSSCGYCEHLLRVRRNVKVYMKCAKHRDTAGPGTDVRLKWRGCEHWSAKTT